MKTMVPFIEMLKFVIRLFRKIIFKLSPVIKNRYVFLSYHGKYSDSPRYVSERLYAQNKKIEIIWLLSKDNYDKVPEYVKVHNIESVWSWWYLGTAEVIFDNVYCNKEFTLYEDDSLGALMYRCHKFLMNKTGQRAYTTFHGTPFKKMDRDQVGSKIRTFICPNTTLIMESIYSENIYKHITFNNLNTVLLGSARIESLISQTKEDCLNLKHIIGVSDKKRIVTYAPTFRNDGKDTEGRNVKRSGLDQLEHMDIKKLLSELSSKFGGEWILLIRFHRHVENLVDWGKLETEFPGMVINGNKINEMNDCLSITDVLISDYSSCVFEYSFINKPCFLYVNDKNHYINTERGLYINLTDLPFAFAEKFEDLIESIKYYNEETYLHRLGMFRNTFGYVDIPGSTDKIVNYIQNKDV